MLAKKPDALGECRASPLYVRYIAILVFLVFLEVNLESIFRDQWTLSRSSPVVLKNDREEDSCAHFKWVDNEELNSSLSMTRFYGRLGNRIRAVANMVAFAEEANCNISLPQEILTDWKAARLNFMQEPNPLLGTNSSELCVPRDGEWYFRKVANSKCHSRLLRQYFEINSTHVFGKPCNHGEYTALHIRGGDVSSGIWNMDTGTYHPSEVHRGYGLFPTSYYISVINHVRSRRGQKHRIMVFCEDLTNPSCEFFQKMTSLDENILIRIGQSILSDLHLMLCSEEIAESRGTFSNVFMLTARGDELVRHTFADSPPECTKNVSSEGASEHNPIVVEHWIASTSEGAEFFNLTKVWRNTGFERHEVNRFRQFRACELHI